MEQRTFTQAFYTLLFAVCLLAVYPVLHANIPYLQNNFRSYTVFGYGGATPAADTTAMVDTLALAAPDTIDLQPVIEEDTIPIPPPTVFDNAANLRSFFERLAEKRGQVRIAYFGDSSIEGDLISQTVRDSLQKRFGGAGVGYMPIYSQVAGFRQSVRHKIGGEWESLRFGKKNPYAIARNITGEFFLARQPKIEEDTLGVDSTIVAVVDTTAEEIETHWVQYGAVRLFPGLRTIPKARLFYGRPARDSLLPASDQQPFVQVTVGENTTQFELDKRKHLNQLWLTTEPCKKVRLDFELPENLPLYGVSLESDQGIIVDNFSARGNSGAMLTHVSGGMMVQFDSLLNYDLVIMQYGLNVINKDMEDYSWYRAEMRRVIRHIKRHMPKAAILLVGPTDKAIKVEGEMMTDPGTPRVNEALRRVAARENVSFFSFYEAMGGEGSMIEWVEEKEPRWANLDYTHFNFRGAHQAGKLLLAYLMNAYEEYTNAPQ